MTQAYVNFMKNNLKDMNTPVKKYRFKKTEKKNLDKVKVKLFCKEKLEEDPDRSVDAFIEQSRALGLIRPPTPLSYYNLVDNIRTICFNGYKLPNDKGYYCLNCFQSTHGIYISPDNESSFLFIGERPYIDPNTYRKYQPRIDDLCSVCWTTLLTVKDLHTQCAFGEEEDQSQ